MAIQFLPTFGQRDFPLFQRGNEGDLATLALAQAAEKSPLTPLYERGGQVVGSPAKN